VRVELRRGPLPSVEEFVAQLREEGIDMHTFDLFEYFLRQPDSDATVLHDAAEELGMDLTPEEEEGLAEGMNGCERSPQVAVTDLSVVTDDKDSGQ
jgi:hypothetical protein